MKCDEVPCKHGGICIEDFENQKHTCDCEHTSYYGELCSEEIGAEFNGESILWRQYILNGTVDYVKFQLAFSSVDISQKNTVLLLLQTENGRSYYLVVGLSTEGHLTVQEDREGAVFSATVNKKNFINGARHSIHYRRDFNDSELYIDRELTSMKQIPAQTFTNIPEEGGNEVQIGGHDTADPRFATYKRYSGCLSNIFIEVNEHVMKPLEEYMLFTKTGTEKVNVSNPHGVRSAQCSSDFDKIHEKTPAAINLNISQGTDKTWVQDAPQRIFYTSIYSATAEEEDSTGQLIVIILSSFFLLVVICCTYHLIITDKKYRQKKEYETDADILLSKQQAAFLQENHKLSIDDNTIKFNGKITTESNKTTPIEERNEFFPENREEMSLKTLKRADSKREKQPRISFRDNNTEIEDACELLTPEILSPMPEEDEEEDQDDDEKDENETDNETDERELDGIEHDKTDDREIKEK
ncbi:unnamed protein product [Psylliodes chrysocephalus]|uniref:Uncharacterized protein n=1 Tax=Psylliodes chrysocephalus TaxID=3402493 RepID=A0A9P0CKM6_9CUCU|nr:unnamed protein product [Psylliodes chrysocephala]